MEKENQLQKSGGSSVGFVDKMLESIESFDKAKELGQFIISSGYAPYHFTGKPEAVVLAIDAGRKIGLDWFQSLQEGYVVNGIPGYRGRILKALVLASNVCEKWETDFTGSLADDTRTCTITYKRVGKSQGEQSRTYSTDMAKQAKLWGKKKKYNKDKKAWEVYEDSWCKFPEDMLEWKCVARVLNDFSDVTKGFRTVEDLQDYEVEEKPYVIHDSGLTVNPNKEATTAAVNESVASKTRAKDEKKKELAGMTTEKVRLGAPIQEPEVVDSKPNTAPAESEPASEEYDEYSKYLIRIQKMAPKDLGAEFKSRFADGKLPFGVDKWLEAGGSKLPKDLVTMLDAGNRGIETLKDVCRGLGMNTEILFPANPARPHDEQLVLMDSLEAAGYDPDEVAVKLGYKDKEELLATGDIEKINALLNESDAK